MRAFQLLDLISEIPMPVITLPDGSQKKFDQPVTVAEVAASIGAGLAKAALAGRVNDKLVDTSFVIEDDAKLSIVTEKDPAALEVIRHSTAHLLAMAVQAIYPKAQVTIGPVIEDGFYYDFAFERPFTPEDLEKFEAKMKEIAAADLKVTRRVMERDAAVALFQSMGEKYKAEIIASIPVERADRPLRPGRVVRPVPRPARAVSTGKLKSLQAHEGGRRLLARRFTQRDAPAHLRHRVAQRQGSRGLPASAGRSRKARSSAHRQGPRPVPFPGRGAGRGVLASRRAGASSSS